MKDWRRDIVVGVVAEDWMGGWFGYARKGSLLLRLCIVRERMFWKS